MEGVLLIASQRLKTLYLSPFSATICIFLVFGFLCYHSLPTLSAGVSIWWELVAFAQFWLCRPGMQPTGPQRWNPPYMQLQKSVLFRRVAFELRNYFCKIFQVFVFDILHAFEILNAMHM